MLIKPIMFEQGNEYLCIKTLDVFGKIFFIQDLSYKCKTDNCLVSEDGQEWFITQDYLTHFFN